MRLLKSSGLKRACSLLCVVLSQWATAQLPEILANPEVAARHYLPDFSYAGYHHGERPIPQQAEGTVLKAVDFGVVADDELDDSRALQRALDAAHAVSGPVHLVLPKGRIILSSVLYIERSHFTLSGAGSGRDGTVIWCPRPMRTFPDPAPLAELREYLVALDKRQREPQNNIDLPFSQYSWAGGMLWVRQPGVRTKAYLDQYDEEPVVEAKLVAGQRGSREVQVTGAHALKPGDVVQIAWYNQEGEQGSILRELYGSAGLKVGSHHWQYPGHALVHQPTRVVSVVGDRVTISDPLLMDAREAWGCVMKQWPHLEEVGIAHLRFAFPDAPVLAHHVEEGYNAIYLTRLYNGWVTDVVIENADSGILTEETANVTISDVETLGSKLAHYSVAMSGVHNVLVELLTVANRVRHPLSFNTFSTRSVYKNCRVLQDPVLDQHSGANHQNLFDQIEVQVSLNGRAGYPLFEGGGAGYWKPSHGAFSTFWNIRVHFQDGFDWEAPVLLNGMKDGPRARLVGIHANRPIQVEYGPDAYLEWINRPIGQVPSLYDYQLRKRLGLNR